MVAGFRASALFIRVYSLIWYEFQFGQSATIAFVLIFVFMALLFFFKKKKTKIMSCLIYANSGTSYSKLWITDKNLIF